MSLFGGRKSKGTTGNSGNASSGGWSLTGVAGGKQKAKAVRNEFPKPKSNRRGSRP